MPISPEDRKALPVLLFVFAGFLGLGAAALPPDDFVELDARVPPPDAF